MHLGPGAVLAIATDNDFCHLARQARQKKKGYRLPHEYAIQEKNANTFSSAGYGRFQSRALGAAFFLLNRDIVHVVDLRLGAGDAIIIVSPR
jgi:hypothetical protein